MKELIWRTLPAVLQPFYRAFAADNNEPFHLKNLGHYAYRNDGEYHAWNPETIARLQIATKTGDYNKYKEYPALVDNKSNPAFIRDLLDYKRNPIDISEVEPAENIMKRFCTGAVLWFN